MKSFARRLSGMAPPSFLVASEKSDVSMEIKTTYSGKKSVSSTFKTAVYTAGRSERMFDREKQFDPEKRSAKKLKSSTAETWERRRRDVSGGERVRKELEDIAGDCGVLSLHIAKAWVTNTFVNRPAAIASEHARARVGESSYPLVVSMRKYVNARIKYHETPSYSFKKTLRTNAYRIMKSVLRAMDVFTAWSLFFSFDSNRHSVRSTSWIRGSSELSKAVSNIYAHATGRDSLKGKWEARFVKTSEMSVSVERKSGGAIETCNALIDQYIQAGNSLPEWLSSVSTGGAELKKQGSLMEVVIRHLETLALNAVATGRDIEEVTAHLTRHSSSDMSNSGTDFIESIIAVICHRFVSMWSMGSMWRDSGVVLIGSQDVKKFSLSGMLKRIVQAKDIPLEGPDLGDIGEKFPVSPEEQEQLFLLVPQLFCSTTPLSLYVRMDTSMGPSVRLSKSLQSRPSECIEGHTFLSWGQAIDTYCTSANMRTRNALDGITDMLRQRGLMPLPSLTRPDQFVDVDEIIDRSSSRSRPYLDVDLEECRRRPLPGSVDMDQVQPGRRPTGPYLDLDREEARRRNTGPYLDIDAEEERRRQETSSVDLDAPPEEFSVPSPPASPLSERSSYPDGEVLSESYGLERMVTAYVQDRIDAEKRRMLGEEEGEVQEDEATDEFLPSMEIVEGPIRRLSERPRIPEPGFARSVENTEMFTRAARFVSLSSTVPRQIRMMTVQLNEIVDELAPIKDASLLSLLHYSRQVKRYAEKWAAIVTSASRESSGRLLVTNFESSGKGEVSLDYSVSERYYEEMELQKTLILQIISVITPLIRKRSMHDSYPAQWESWVSLVAEIQSYLINKHVNADNDEEYGSPEEE